jgi:menaquinone-dependent protoporphyrinogen oxidase
MLKLLIVYGTTEGQTRKIARYMAASARGAMHYVRELDSTVVPPDFQVADYDAVIVGASVYQGRHQRSVIALVREFLDALERLPTAFFSVSLEAALAGQQHRDEAQSYIADFLVETGWKPGMTQAIAGALSFTKYDYLRRVATDLIPLRGAQRALPAVDQEYTDWDAVGRFIREFLQRAERRRTMPLTQPA